MLNFILNKTAVGDALLWRRVDNLQEKFGDRATPYTEYLRVGQAFTDPVSSEAEILRMEGMDKRFSFDLTKLELPPGPLPPGVCLVLPAWNPIRGTFRERYQDGKLMKVDGEDIVIVHECGAFVFKTHTKHEQAFDILKETMEFVNNFCSA